MLAFGVVAKLPHKSLQLNLEEYAQSLVDGDTPTQH